MNAADRQLLLQVIDKLDALHAKVDALTREPVDHATLLHAIAQSIGGREFTVGELFLHAQEDEVLEDALAGRSPKQVARIFRTIEGRNMGGYHIARLGPDNGSVLWRVYGDHVPQTP